MASRDSKGKGRAAEEGDNGNTKGNAASKGKDESSSGDPFSPPKPKQGPSLQPASRDEAKPTLRRQPKSSTADSTSARSPTPGSESTQTARSPTEDPQSASRSPEAADSESRQVGQAQPFRYTQRVRIREDVSKSTSFDRARDGDELYELWVGPP